jgi:hypothetical protein
VEVARLQQFERGVVEEDPSGRPEWQLVERILATQPFQKSTRLPSLLRYLTLHSLTGNLHELSEQVIGKVVLGKPTDYSPAEDSAVRVHVRQLRLRLHEYFATEGREETLIADIPKGSYEIVFYEEPAKPQVAALQPALPKSVPNLRMKAVLGVAFILAILAAAICGVGWYRAARAAQAFSAPWPISAVLARNVPTRLVVSDGSSMLRLMTKRQISLEEYLEPGARTALAPAKMDENISQLVKYIQDSEITSFADTAISATLMRLAGPESDSVTLVSARDLNRRDLEKGNFIFVGGPTSNPWVSLFSDKLNFQTVEDVIGGRMYFLNRNPRKGEQPQYEGLRFTGSGGEDYATISLLPMKSGRGSVLLLQGLREEGTEALGLFLSDENLRTKLKQALGTTDDPARPVYFEALVKASTVAGAPLSISLVAIRRITP